MLVSRFFRGVDTMDRPTFLQDFQQRVLEMLRASPAADVERNLKALMGQTFNKLELVNRDEFQVQIDLLQALRTRVDALESRLSRLESASQQAVGGPPD
jgi:BMFP domain-containing protein YqiC